MILLTLLFSPAFSQMTKIFGKAETAIGYMIKLKTFSDYLSMTEQQISECVIQPDGSFLLETDLSFTKMCILVIGFQKTEIYLEPGKSYELLIAYNHGNERITYVNTSKLDTKFINLPLDDLNNQIGDFNYQANNFLVKNFNRIYKNRDKNIINDFNTEIRQHFQNPSEYLTNYIDFRIASIEYNSGLKNRLTIFHNYFEGRDILYVNDEYMQFIRQLFENYLSAPNPYFDITQLRSEIFGKTDLEIIFSMFSKDPLLKNAALKELVLLNGLYELSFNPNVDKSTLCSAIEKIGQTSLFPKHKKIAFNLVRQLNYLQPGTKFPQDYLTQLKNKNFCKDLDKAIFINFFTLPCADCVREMDSIAGLFQKYSKEVQFVSIALNSTDDEVKKLVSVKKYSWQIFLATQAFELAEIYRIHSLPTYFLIDSNSKILMNPALVPWRGFSSAFGSVFEY